MSPNLQPSEQILYQTQCVNDDNGRWHVVMDLDVSRDQMSKEVAEFYLTFDDGRPLVAVQQVGRFARLHAKGTWCLKKAGVRKLRRAEGRKVLDMVRWIAGYYATIEVRDPKREQLPALSSPKSSEQEPPALGDGFTVIRTYACPNELTKRTGRTYFTVPQEADLFVTEVLCGGRVVEISAYGINRSALRVLKSQGVPYGVPDEKQWQLIDSYFWRRAQALTTRLDHHFLGLKSTPEPNPNPTKPN